MGDESKATSSAPDSSSSDGAQGAKGPRAPVDSHTLRRRKFLTRVTLGLGAASAGSIIWSILGFVIAPVVRKNSTAWRDVGSVDDFAVGSTKVVTFQDASTVPWAGYAGRSAAWLRRDSSDTFTCFSVNCTHLGCPVRWEEGSELFMCPCHGGVYYKDGIVAAGPPPKPLPRYNVRIKNGKVQVEASSIPLTL